MGHRGKKGSIERAKYEEKKENHTSISNATVEAATFHALALVLLSNKDENDKLLRSISIIIIQKQNITYICRFTKELSNFGLAVEPLHSGGVCRATWGMLF